MGREPVEVDLAVDSGATVSVARLEVVELEPVVVDPHLAVDVAEALAERAQIDARLGHDEASSQVWLRERAVRRHGSVDHAVRVTEEADECERELEGHAMRGELELERSGLVDARRQSGGVSRPRD